MQNKNGMWIEFIFSIIMVCVFWSGLATGEYAVLSREQEQIEEPVLYIAAGEGNDVEMVAADGNILRKAVGFKAADVNLADVNGLGLVIVTHGWLERTRWPEETALAIRGKVDSRRWVCGWYDWRGEARRISPIGAAEYARDIGGPFLGKRIAALSKAWGHVHLIGHSAGSWVISEAAKTVARETDASIHLTFLDAYVPLLWDANELCGFSDEPKLVWWADHYLTWDLTLGVTAKQLFCAHNVDLTEVDPGIKDHEFPRYWYHGTVIGEYAKGERYEGKKLYKKLGTVEYGFARSLEAGEKNWEVSRGLKTGNKPVKIRLPKRELERPYERFYRWRQRGN
jgi:pimeloyl-ACP methyl ester carboxylesterase